MSLNEVSSLAGADQTFNNLKLTILSTPLLKHGPNYLESLKQMIPTLMMKTMTMTMITRWLSLRIAIM